MPDLAITALPDAGAVVSTDIFPMVSDPGGSPAIRKVTVAQIAAAGAAATPPASTGTFADPNSNVTADVGRFYIDTNTNTLWYKKTGSGNTGWEQLL